jgi:F420-non-reducing hydrogenase iron-sulfur subunit
MNSAKIHLFCCSTAIDSDELIRADNGRGLKVMPLPCSGKMDILYLTKAFETGADGVAVVTCKKGDCRYLEGNLRAEKRVSAVESLLEEIGVGKGRIAVIQLGDGGAAQVLKEVDKFCSGISAMPAGSAGH